MTVVDTRSEGHARASVRRAGGTAHDAEQAVIFMRFLTEMPDPESASLHDWLRLDPEVRDFAMPGYGPLTELCDYSGGMGT